MSALQHQKSSYIYCNSQCPVQIPFVLQITGPQIVSSPYRVPYGFCFFKFLGQMPGGANANVSAKRLRWSCKTPMIDPGLDKIQFCSEFQSVLLPAVFTYFYILPNKNFTKSVLSCNCDMVVLRREKQ